MDWQVHRTLAWAGCRLFSIPASIPLVGCVHKLGVANLIMPSTANKQYAGLEITFLCSARHIVKVFLHITAGQLHQIMSSWAWLRWGFKLSEALYTLWTGSCRTWYTARHLIYKLNWPGWCLLYLLKLNELQKWTTYYIVDQLICSSLHPFNLISRWSADLPNTSS